MTAVKSPRLFEAYKKNIVPHLKKQFGYKNVNQAPRLEKIVLNMGVGKGASDIKVIERAQAELGLITGQRPLVTRAKKSISNFKIRENDPIGLKVTLRGRRMYEFLDRLLNVAMPRIKDFRGVPPTGFDSQGNYALGLKEQLIFPEIEYDRVEHVQGMDVVFRIKAKSKDESFELLKAFGMPFGKG